MPDADVRLMRDFLPVGAANDYLQALRSEVAWQQDSIRLYGRTHKLPRLHQWYADAGIGYRWSGIEMQPLPWLTSLHALRRRVETCTGERFNSVLVNLYRDGSDAMGWHADDEPELGNYPVIASISLGVTRDFRLRRRDGARNGSARTIALTHGSLIVMAGNTQHYWQHSLPRRKRVSGARINLTFRRILLDDS